MNFHQGVLHVLAGALTLVLVAGWVAAAPLVTVVCSVEEVQGNLITTEQGTSHEVDARTEYAKKVKGREVKAKLADLKPGIKIEVQRERGARFVKRIVIR
jgi:hypothetical protein